MNEKDKKNANQSFALLPIGIGIGVAFGALISNIGVGMALGAALGTIASLVKYQVDKKRG